MPRYVEINLWNLIKFNKFVDKNFYRPTLTDDVNYLREHLKKKLLSKKQVTLDVASNHEKIPAWLGSWMHAPFSDRFDCFAW